MVNYDLSLEYKICLQCKKLRCNGYCQDYRDYMRSLRENNLVPKRGRPKKSQNK